jgi:hypothetical protein
MSSLPTRARIACGAALSLGIVACTNDYDGLLAASASETSTGSGAASGTGGGAPGSGGVGAAGPGTGGTGATGAGGAKSNAGGAGGAAPPCAPGNTYQLSDDFEDGVYAAGWEEFESGSAIAAETVGTLHVEVAETAGFGNWAGVRGAVSNLRGCRILVRAVEVPSSEALAYLGFNMPDSSDGVAIAANDGGIFFCVTNLATPDCEMQSHDAAHVWWQIREDQDQVYFETSTDGRVWGIRRQIDAPDWVDAGEPEIGAGTQYGLPATRQAALDDFNRPP